jgi:hypothetical protein
MTQLLLVDGIYDSSPSQTVNRLPDDWLVYAALLPTLLTLASIILTAATGFGAITAGHDVWNTAAVSAIRGDADDYVQGLAKLGITKLPAVEKVPPAR